MFFLFFQLATSSHSLEKRDYVIRELVDTECNYVDVLSKIIKYFLRPMVAYLKAQDLHVIFFGIKVSFFFGYFSAISNKILLTS